MLATHPIAKAELQHATPFDGRKRYDRGPQTAFITSQMTGWSARTLLVRPGASYWFKVRKHKIVGGFTHLNPAKRDDALEHTRRPALLGFVA